MSVKIEIPDKVDIRISIDEGDKDKTYEVGRRLQNYLQDLFDNNRFTIREASFNPYIILFGCPIIENVWVMKETIEIIIKGFLTGKKEENGQD